MNLLDEIKRRMKDDSDVYQALGAEIKQHRIKQSKTLSGMAEKHFSISYLCKIEKNQVKPSKKYLKEICDKVNISDDKVCSLLNSRDILLETVKAFYLRDLKTESDILFKCEGLDNHRILLVRLICALTRLNIIECDDYITKLWSLSSSLANMDLIIFTTFYGIYKYYTGNYLEAMDYIKTALEFNVNISYLKPIQYGYLFISSYKTYSRATIDYYRRLEQLSLTYGSSLKLEAAHYYMCIYYLSIRQFNSFKMNLIKLDQDKLIYSLNIIKSILLNEPISIEEDRLNDLAKAYYYVHIGSNQAIDVIEHSSIPTIDKLLLQYLYYKNNDIIKSLDYLIDVVMDYLIKQNISYLGYRLLDEILNSPLRPAKYKRITELFQEFYRISLVVDSE